MFTRVSFSPIRLLGRFALALLLVTAAPASAQTPAGSLLAPLKAGGLVIYVRHGVAEIDKDLDAVGLGGCAAQRKMSPQGRADMSAFGAAVRSLGLPIGPIFSSPYCRAVESALQALGPPTVRTDLRLWHGELSETDRRDLPIAAKAFLRAAFRPGSNVFVFAHNYKDVLGMDLDQGEAAILAPDAADGFRVIGRLKPQAWAELAAPTRPFIAAFPLPDGARPAAILADGRLGLWWLAGDGSRIGRIDGATGAQDITPLSLPEPAGQLQSDQAGRLWLLTSGGKPLLSLRIGDGPVPEGRWLLTDGLPRHAVSGETADLGLGPFDALSASGDHVWLLQASRNRVIRADLAGPAAGQ